MSLLFWLPLLKFWSLAQTLIAGGVLAGYAPEALKADWLPRIASGEALVVLAYQERKARYKLDVCEAKATQSGVKWSLSATKHVVPAGDQADAFIVPATVDGTIALFLVERSAAGVTTRGYGTQDGARAADVSLQNAPAELITTEGLTALEHAVDIGIAAACAEAVGVMDKTMAITAEYLNTRKQFGVPIGSFQALQHRMADLLLEVEQARSAVINAAAALDEPDRAKRERALSAAKVTVGRVGTLVAEESIQLHGGIGMTWELPLAHYAKRLVMIDHRLGDEDHHLERYIALGRA